MSSFLQYQMDPLGQARFFGVYKGTVVDSDDPLNQNRLRLTVPALFANEPTEWAEAMMPPIAETRVTLPYEGDTVWVMFEGGNPDFPIWIGAR